MADRFFLAVYLSSGVVQAALWQVVSGVGEVLAVSPILPYGDNDEAVVQTDRSLQELGKESEGVSEVIFGLEPDWVTNQGLVDERKPLLKKITEGLGLKPIGYLDRSEAVFQHFIQSEPLFSAVVIEVAKECLWVQLLLRGEWLGTQRVGRSDDVVADVNEGLARFADQLGHHKLPVRMLLYSASDSDLLKKHQQELTGNDWLATQPFLHTPTIELLPETFLIDTLVEQGGRALGGSPAAPVAPAAVVATTPTTTFAEPPAELEPVSAAEFGFSEIEPTSSATTFGVPVEAAAEVEELPVRSTAKFKLPALPAFKFGQMAMPASLINAEHWAGSHKRFAALGFGSGILVLLLISWWYLATKPLAVIEVVLATQTVTQDTRLTLDPKATAPDVANSILPARQLTESVSGEVSVPATGVKDVGEAATGKVLIYNKTTASKTLDKGTTLQAGKLKFSLNEAVTIASASVTTSAGSESKTFGKAEASVVAAAIGTESNIAQATVLTVASFDASSFSAEASQAFTGGSSREVQVIAKKDVTTAQQQLQQQLEQQLDQQLKDKNEPGVYYTRAGTAKLTNPEVTPKEGEAADTLQLKATLEATVFAYQVSDLKPLAKQLLEAKLSSGYRLTDAEPQILSSPAASTSGKVVIEANLSGVAEPVIEWTQVIAQLKGRPRTQALSIITQQAGVKAATIKIIPPLVDGLVKSMPGAIERISVKVQDK